VDVYSGYVHGRLVENLQNSVQHVKYVHETYVADQHRVKLIAADQGIMSQSLFRVTVPDVQKYLREQGIQSEVGEAYNHDHGTSHVERVIRTVKELQRFAMLYVLNNPNFRTFGFTKLQILKLWGELFHWAVTIINLKPCAVVPNKTKYEVYHHRKPDLRDIRLLPIFSAILVLRRSANEALNSTSGHWQRGLYVGPSPVTKGAVRVAVITNGHFMIITSTAFKAVSDGGAVSPYASVERATPSLVNEYHEPLPAAAPTATVPRFPTVPPGLSPASAAVDTAVPSAVPADPSLHSAPTPSVLGDGTADLRPEVRTPGRSSTVRGSESPPGRGSGLSDKSGAAKSGKARKSPPEPAKQSTQSKRAPQPQYDPNRVSREDRMKKRVQAQFATHAEELLECCYIDWSYHNDDTIYWCYEDCRFVTIGEFDAAVNTEVIQVVPEELRYDEEAYRAVTENVPKSFAAALRDPVWSEAARKELLMITTNTNCIVEVDQQIARENIKAGAEVLRLLAVYEEKIKEGKLVRKVRLVADGRHHHKHGPTYAATPSREELLMLLHIFATEDMDYYFTDEERAFLKADRRDDFLTYAKLTGDSRFYQILKALYGMKTASRDHHMHVRDRLTLLGFKRLTVSSSVYRFFEDGALILVYVYVDDFIFGATCTKKCLEKIHEFEKLATLSKPELNATSMLGVEVERDKEKRVIYVTMKRKIAELGDTYESKIKRGGKLKKRDVPMPTIGYIVREEELEKLPERAAAILKREEIEEYMSIIGSLIWIQGVRMDIIFAVLYLAWFTKKPRQHHLDMAYYCTAYLVNTIDIPLVLGGKHKIQIYGFTDASLGTGPKSRSITAEIIALNEFAGAIYAKSTASQIIALSSFECELDGTAKLMKSVARVSHILDDMGIDYEKPSKLYSDNLAMIKFVKGEGVAKGVRHMQMRLWYTREEYLKGNVDMDHMAGVEIPPDKLTKLGSVADHRPFTRRIQGLDMISKEFMKFDEG
jgi:hypothetical protein